MRNVSHDYDTILVGEKVVHSIVYMVYVMVVPQAI